MPYPTVNRQSKFFLAMSSSEQDSVLTTLLFGDGGWLIGVIEHQQVIFSQFWTRFLSIMHCCGPLGLQFSLAKPVSSVACCPADFWGIRILATDLSSKWDGLITSLPQLGKTFVLVNHRMFLGNFFCSACFSFNLAEKCTLISESKIRCSNRISPPWKVRLKVSSLCGGRGVRGLVILGFCLFCWFYIKLSIIED